MYAVANQNTSGHIAKVNSRQWHCIVDRFDIVHTPHRNRASTREIVCRPAMFNKTVVLDTKNATTFLGKV